MSDSKSNADETSGVSFNWILVEILHEDEDLACEQSRLLGPSSSLTIRLKSLFESVKVGIMIPIR